MIRLTIALLFFGALSITSGLSYGSQAWVASSLKPSGLQELFQINLTTGRSHGEYGDWTIAGTADTTSVWELASAPKLYPDLLWGVTGATPGDASELLVINPYHRRIVSRITIDLLDPIYSLAMHPEDGTLYGASITNLYTIDPLTGATTLIGAHGAILLKGMGFDSSGRLLGTADIVTGSIVEIDTATAELTQLLVGESVDIAEDPDDGTIYTISDPRLSPAFLSSHDIEGGVTNVIGGLRTPNNNRLNAFGLAFTNVPEPTTTVSLLIGLLTLAGGVRSRR